MLISFERQSKKRGGEAVPHAFNPDYEVGVRLLRRFAPRNDKLRPFAVIASDSEAISRY
jgi:hypothetical protein